mgnify:CR=1 FL=1
MAPVSGLAVGFGGVWVGAAPEFMFIPDADGDDVTQAVLIKLAVKMRSFVYRPGGSFRAWLKTVTWRIQSRMKERAKGGVGEGGSQQLSLLDSVAAQEDLQRLLEAHAERELFELASERIRARVDSKTWRAFELLTVRGCSGDDAARQLDIDVLEVVLARAAHDDLRFGGRRSHVARLPAANMCSLKVGIVSAGSRNHHARPILEV